MARDGAVNVARDGPHTAGHFDGGVQGAQLGGQHAIVVTQAAQHIVHGAGVELAESLGEGIEDLGHGGWRGSIQKESL